VSALRISNPDYSVDDLLSMIEARLDALLQPSDEPLTDAQWSDVFALWDARRLLASSAPDDLRLAAAVVGTVRR
jgi:hypothetical protein